VPEQFVSEQRGLQGEDVSNKGERNEYEEDEMELRLVLNKAAWG